MIIICYLRVEADLEILNNIHSTSSIQDRSRDRDQHYISIFGYISAYEDYTIRSIFAVQSNLVNPLGEVANDRQFPTEARHRFSRPARKLT